jgi:hypothetical protein
MFFILGAKSYMFPHLILSKFYDLLHCILISVL